MTEEVINELPEELKKHVCKLKKASKDDSNGEAMQIKLSLLSDYQCLDMEALEAWKKIKSNYISDDIRIYICFYYMFNQFGYVMVRKRQLRN